MPVAQQLNVSATVVDMPSMSASQPQATTWDYRSYPAGHPERPQGGIVIRAIYNDGSAAMVSSSGYATASANAVLPPVSVAT